MGEIKNLIDKNLSELVAPDVTQQYLLYKKNIEKLYLDFQSLKTEAQIIGGILQKLKNQQIINSHITNLQKILTNSNKNSFYSLEVQADFEKIKNYFAKVQNTCVFGLKTIFAIRKFFTQQDFVIFLEENGKIFEFNIEDIEKFSDSIIPVYTNSLDKMIKNMLSTSNTFAPELNKLALSLKRIDSEQIKEIKELSPYQEFVAYHVEKNKKKIKPNRQLEAAVYLYTRNSDSDFNNNSFRHSLHIMLGKYISQGGLSDTIAMYKFGDAIQNVNQSFKNIEIKMHNGTISLTMIANGVNKLYNIFNTNNLTQIQQELIKFFTAKEERLSSPIEKQSQKIVVKNITEVIKNLNLNLTI